MLHTTHLSQHFKYEDADDMYTHQAGAMLSYSMLDSILQSRNHRFNLNAKYERMLIYYHVHKMLYIRVYKIWNTCFNDYKMTYGCRRAVQEVCKGKMTYE